MRYLFIISLSIILVSSCNDAPQEKTESVLKTDSSTIVDSSEILMEDEEYPSDSLMENLWGNDSIKLQFDASLILNYETSTCVYFFDYRYENDKVVSSWQLDTLNCPIEVGLFELQSHPKKGEDFAIYDLVNDTLLKVSYSNPELVSKINTEIGFELFPTTITILKK